MKTKAHKVLSLMLTLILLIAAVPTAMVSASAATTYKGVDYAPVYDYNFYMGHPDLKKVYGNNPTGAFNHFVKYGMKEGRQASPNFNVEIYKANYADLRNAFGNDLPSYYKHYVQFGIKEGRNAVTSLNGGGASSASSSSSTSTSSGSSSSSASSSSSSSTNEWTVSKATDGSRAIVLKNNRTGKTYTVTNSTDYAKIRYGRAVDQGISTEFTNLLNNFFGAVYVPHTHEHKLTVREENNYCYVYCKTCQEKFSYKDSKLSLDEFSLVLNGSNFNQLSGKLDKTNSAKYITAYKWLSYALGINYADAKKYLNENAGNTKITVKDPEKLADFVKKLNYIADLYQFNYAGSLSKVLGKASLNAVFRDPSSTVLDKYIAVVSFFSSGLGFLLQTYKTVGECMIAMAAIGAAPVLSADWSEECPRYGITFEGPTKKLSVTPLVTPTYTELFEDNIIDGRTNLDRFVNYVINDSSQFTGFDYLCEHKDDSRNTEIIYNYIIGWLVRPALNKEFAGCTQYSTIEELVKDIKK